MNALKSQIYQNLENAVKRNNLTHVAQIEDFKRKLSAPIENTEDFLKTETELYEIKKVKLHRLNTEMKENITILLKLHEMDYGFIQADVIQKVYLANEAKRNLIPNI